MKKVIIVGAAGHSAEIQDYINSFNRATNETSERLSIVGYLDDNSDSYYRYDFIGPYLGDIKSHSIKENHFYIMGIANMKYRRTIVTNFLDKGANFITLIHPSAYISGSAKIGAGVIVAPNANIGPKVVIGNYNLINSRASIGHDTFIGNFNFISPNVCFSGFTTVGDENLFGINSATIPGVKIGDNNTIAAGMIVDKNIKSRTTVFHRFKEKIMIIKK